MQSLVRARQFKDVFTVRQEGDHVQQSIRRKDVVDASNSTRVVFCAGPFARRRLNRRRLCLDIHFDDSFFLGGGALICGRDKIETRFRLYVERRSARRRGKERKKERKKELSRALSRRGRSSSSSSSSSSFGARSSFLLRCRSKKTPKGRGPSFFRTFFFAENQNRERKNNMEWKKKTRRLSFCVFFNVSLQFSFHFIIICRDDNKNKNKNKNNYLSTSHALYHNTQKRETTTRLFNTHPSILIIIIIIIITTTTYEDAFPTTTTTTTTTATTTTKSTSSSSTTTKSSTTKKANKFFTTKGDGTRRVHPKEQSRHGNDRIRADGTLAIEWNVLGTDRCCADEEDKRNNEQR